MEEKIKCKCQRCGYRWNYKGKKIEAAKKAKFPVFISCPQCRHNVKLEVKK